LDVRGVVHRSAEFLAIANFLRSADVGPSGLLLEGDAGIGKTTLWLAGLEQAGHHGFGVLSARASDAESVLAYGTVADLLGDVPSDVLAGLPDVQRVALDRVMLRDTRGGPATDQQVVAAATTSVIEAISQHGPVLIAIDDLQWLDQSSRAVVAFVARRLRGRAGLLVTARSESDSESALSWLGLAMPDRIDRVRVGPLSLGGLHQLVSTRLGRSLSRPTMVQIAQVSGGNPLYALELARATGGRSSSAVADLPRTLTDLVRMRVGDLDKDAPVYLAAACVADPTVDMLAQVTGTTVARTTELLEAAEAKGVITVDGNRVRYSHPLLARGVYTAASPGHRRRIHRALADVVTLPELKARHLALAASTKDPELLRTLDEAAKAARARGAPAAAAELLDLAISLGGDTPLRRTLSAEHHLRAGDTEKASDLLKPAIKQLGPGSLRAVALNLLAGIGVYRNSFVEAVHLLERAVDDAEGDPGMLAQTLIMLAFAQSSAGDYHDALRSARLAVSHAEALGVPAFISQSLANYVTVNALAGNGVDESALVRALELDDPDFDATIALRAGAANAQVLSWIGRLDEAQAQLQDLRRYCVERGADGDLMFVSVYSALVAIWRGRYGDAAQAAEEAVERAEQIGGHHMLVIARTLRASVAAYTGCELDARTNAAAAIEAAEECDSPRMVFWPLILMGFLETSMGRYDEALTALRPLCAYADEMPGTEIMMAGFIPDAVEAMVALGRLDEAEPMIKALEHNGHQLDRPWMLAVGARCRAMMLAAQGDVDAAETAAQSAITDHRRLPMPFERARTQLLLGQLQRRRRQKQAATATLEDALRTFEELGSRIWADRARAELERTNVRPRCHPDLTPSERRVAELAASGMTTGNIAAQLFVSPKTVQANLTRIYRKLGIHSRAELGALMRVRPERPSAER
jgi:DNA-binding CsgD family transcriptional regulator